MTTVGNSSPGNRPARRLRFDGHPANREATQRAPAAGHSGRRLVLAGALAFLLIGGGLALWFRDWRTRYLVRAAYGARQVAAAIDPLAEVVPPDVARDEWRGTVADAHAMLVTLMASNMLDFDQMRDLRAELTARVARARPETARAELADLWNSLARRAGPNLVKRHPRPRLLDRSAPGP
jgi:hypothetical protein